MKNHQTLILKVVISIIASVVFIFFIKWMSDSDAEEAKDYAEKLAAEYPQIMINDSLRIKISSMQNRPSKYRNDPNTAEFTGADGKKYGIWVKGCLSFPDCDFEEVINIGDSLIKLAGSDTITVINKKGKFLFKMHTHNI